jgi:hypothetical protein
VRRGSSAPLALPSIGSPVQASPKPQRIMASGSVASAPMASKLRRSEPGGIPAGRPAVLAIRQSEMARPRSAGPTRSSLCPTSR